MGATQRIELVSIPEAARRLGIGLRQMKRAVRCGELPVFAIGGWPRLRWRDVLAWISTRRTSLTPHPEAQETPQRGEAKRQRESRVTT
jgi:excisionase family DNA binding protein